ESIWHVCSRRGGFAPVTPLVFEGQTMHLSNESLLVILFVGLISGWLAGRGVGGSGFGVVGGFVVGFFGALVWDLLLPRLNIHLGVGIVALIVNAFLGAVVLLFILRLIGRRGWRLRRWGRRW